MAKHSKVNKVSVSHASFTKISFTSHCCHLLIQQQYKQYQSHHQCVAIYLLNYSFAQKLIVTSNILQSNKTEMEHKTKVLLWGQFYKCFMKIHRKKIMSVYRIDPCCHIILCFLKPSTLFVTLFNLTYSTICQIYINFTLDGHNSHFLQKICFPSLTDDYYFSSHLLP